jgi:hypothetical protein
VTKLLEQAWRSESLADCPTFGEWLIALPESEAVGDVQFADTSANGFLQATSSSQEGSAARENKEEPRETAKAPIDSSPQEVGQLASMFKDARKAYQDGEYRTARELLVAIVQREPTYGWGGDQANELLEKVEHKLKQRGPAWVWWLVGGGAGLGLITLCVLATIGIGSLSSSNAQIQPTNVPTRVAPTHPIPSRAPTSTRKPAPVPTQRPGCPSAPPIRVDIGDIVRITENNGIPLYLRSKPVVGPNIQWYLYGGTRLKILDGPVCSNGVSFFKVEVLDTHYIGWVHEADADSTNYLIEPVP